MQERPRDIPPTPPPEDASGKAVAALISSVLGLAHFCPCVGPILGILLGLGERSSVGRAAVVLGGVGLALQVLEILVVVVHGLLFGWL